MKLLAILLTVLFIGLKLTNYITWSWVWVLSPFWIWFLVSIGLILIIAILGGISAIFKE